MRRRTRVQGIIIQNGQILLVHHYDMFIRKTYWCLPGGGLETGEAPEQAIVREMKEETNLDVRVKRFLNGQRFVKVDHGYDTTMTFLIEAVTEDLKLGYDPEFLGTDIQFLQDVKWVDIDSTLMLRLQNYFFAPQSTNSLIELLARY